MENNILVSVVVVTYNSEKTVIETLDSIASQTYRNIELIVSDDASQDKTVELCKKWIIENEDRFINTELITATENTGISANANRGVKKARGEWLKLIAGDDLLDNRGIELFISTYKGGSMIVCCDFISFSDSLIKPSNSHSKALLSKEGEKFHKRNAEEQLVCLLLGYRICAPSTIIRKDLFIKIGRFDERFQMIEDYPFWIKALSKGFRIDYCPILMAYYRIGNSVSRNSSMFYNEKYINCLLNYEKEMTKSALPCKPIIWLTFCFNSIAFTVFFHIFGNRKTKLSITLFNFYTKATHKVIIYIYNILYSNKFGENIFKNNNR